MIGCERPPNITTTNATEPQRRVEAEPFNGEIFRSSDGRHSLTLISKDECELRSGTTTLLCKYTKQSDALRVVATTLGTNQVIYYRVIDQGLQDNEGKVLLSPVRYSAAMQQMQQAQEAKERLRREAEQMRRQEEDKQRREVERRIELTRKSKIETKVVLKATARFWDTPAKITLTDTSLKIDASSHNKPPMPLWFGDIRNIGFSHVGDRTIEVGISSSRWNDTGWQQYDLQFPNAAEAAKFQKAVVSQVDAWKTAFPDVRQ